MIRDLRSDLQSKENIDEKWLESLQSMESHYIQENQARKEKLIEKNHVDANGSVTEIQFDIKENNPPKNPEEKESKYEEPTSLRKKIQKFFGRK